VAIMLACLAFGMAVQISSAAGTDVSSSTDSCKNIVADQQASIKLGKTQSVIQGLDISKYTSVKYIISSRNDSPTRVRSELTFYGSTYRGTDLAYAFPGETTVKTFLTNSSPKLDVQIYSYSEGDRNAHNNVTVNVEGCK
ncbi:MAG TPA: hypothetical protein VKR06_37020, partial [Ktedonosporobacter sp.]|nr:hypothetical protein [Ktedonosporobacter sp.]